VSKVLIITEENESAAEVVGSPSAPYLAQLAAIYGSATRMDAGYPVLCPSLAAYIILTSGSDHGICDDGPPSTHPLDGDSVFQQVQKSGRQWRAYAESMPANCTQQDAGQGFYLVRHVPSSYYTAIRDQCQQWQIPLETPTAGSLHRDLAAGTLPAYSFVTPNACNDMHGARGCPNDKVATGDAWLARWMPSIISGPDFRSGRLAVIITWDEGSQTDNHIPTLVLSTHTHQVSAKQPWNHCSTLRTTEEILGLPLLGCARNALSMRSAFNL
jgi:hypothetical protein